MDKADKTLAFLLALTVALTLLPALAFAAPIPTNLALEPVYGVAGEVYQLKATLTDTDGNPINAALVIFYLADGTLLFSMTTGSNGVAQTAFHNLTHGTAGNTTIYAIYAGDTTYDGSRSADAPFIIVQPYTLAVNSGTGGNNANPAMFTMPANAVTLTAKFAPIVAAVSSVTISGTVGSALGGGQSATLTLTNDTVKIGVIGLDVPGWFTGLPAGLTVTADTLAGSDRITLAFGGTPTAVSTAAFNITIPGSFLTGGNPIAVANNPNARFHITGQRPPSALPQTGDGFPLRQLLALVGVGLIGLGWAGYRMRSGKRA